jgi:hypothetical protein
LASLAFEQAFSLSERRNKEESDSENEIGMSKRKNEVVFTLIQEGIPKSSASFLRPLIPTCGWKGTLFVTDVLHST